MTLPASGAISLGAIQTEYGGTNPAAISEYYRGGGLVPNAAPNLSVPTSGAISFSNFYGGAAVSVQFAGSSNIAYEDTNYPFDVTAGFTISSAGTYTHGGSNPTWLLSGSASSYDLYLTSFSGNTPSGLSANTAYNLGTTRSMSLTQTGNGIKTFSCTLEIRDTGTSTVRASGSLELIASIGEPIF